MWHLFESKGEEEQRVHNEGQADGSKAGPVGQLFHAVLGSLLSREEYNKGYDNGTSNQPSARPSTKSEQQSTSGSNSDWGDWSPSTRVGVSAKRRSIGRLVAALLILLLVIATIASFVGQRSGSGAQPQTSATKRIVEWEAPGVAEAAQLDRANEILGLIYNQLMNSLNREQQVKLRDEERDWIKWRDDEAERVARQSSVGGSAFRIDYTNALLTLTKQRHEYLKNYNPRGDRPSVARSAPQKSQPASGEAKKPNIEKFRRDKQKFDQF